MRSRFDTETRLSMLAVPVHEKCCLSLQEASAYTGIGVSKLRELSNGPDCSFVLWVGNRRLLKKKRLEEFLDGMYSV